MRRQLLFVFPLLPLCWNTAPSGEPVEESHFAFMPGSILVRPFTANYQEPRVGLRKDIGSSHLKLDIGSTLDVLEYTISAGKSKRLRAGVDFFTYALSTSVEGRRLQIDAVDGFFGGHVSYQESSSDESISFRFRFLHLSAHFIDGHFDNKTGTWKNGMSPIPFTRDFGELIGAFEHRWSDVSMMVYTGFSYATLIRPEEIKHLTTIHGVEVHTSNALCAVFGKPFSLFVADNLSLVGIPSYIGTNNIELGMKFGEWSGAGIRLYVSYYSGLTIFSQYYNIREENWGLGFTFDVW